MTTEQPATPDPLSVLWDEFAEAAILDAEYGEDIELEPYREAIYDFIRADTAAPLEEALVERQRFLHALHRFTGPPPKDGSQDHGVPFADCRAQWCVEVRALSSPGGGE